MTEPEIKKHMKTANTFNQRGEAYVHGECKGGESQLIISGEGVTLIRVIAQMAERIGVQSGQGFDDVIDAVKAMHLLDSEGLRN